MTAAIRIEVPCFVAIDSSVLGNVSRDLYHANAQTRSKAKRFLSGLVENSLIPVLSFHHLEELLHHQNKKVVRDRVDFLRRLHSVAWMADVDDASKVGSILDLQIRELRVVMRNELASYPDIIREARIGMFGFGTGETFVASNEDFVHVIPLFAERRMARRNEIASLSHSKFAGTAGKKLSDFRESRLNSRQEADQAFAAQRRRLARDLATQGDKRIKSPDLLADAFLDEVRRDGKDTCLQGADVISGLLQLYGVDSSDVTESTSLDDMGYLGVLRSQLKTLARRGKCDYARCVRAAGIHTLPSWRLWMELDKRMKAAGGRASGSDINDRYLAPLAFYVGRLVVDKRIKDKLDPLLRACPSLGQLCCPIEKCPKAYADLFAKS